MFPKRYTVTHIPCTSMGEDAMGNDLPTFGDPVARKVYGWSASRTETRTEQSSGGGATIETGFTSRDVAEIDLALPASVPVGLSDRFILDPSDTGRPYEVVAIRDNNHGFHGWRPGIVVGLKRVSG